MSWKSTIQTLPEGEENKPSQPSWRDSIQTEKEAPSELESATRGAAQGLSLGFADEATGAAEAALDWLKNDPKGFMDNYRKHRDESRANYSEAEKANPKSYMGGQIAGAVGSAFVPGMQGATLGKLAALGAAQGLGNSSADITTGNTEDLVQAAKDTGLGAGIGAAAYGVSKIPFGKILNKAADKADDVAERLAVNATGATGRASENFAPGTGRQLLDKGIVGFGDTAENVAQKAGAAMEQAGGTMDDVLRTLDSSGAKASVDDVVSTLEQKINDLSQSPGNESLIKQLQKEVDNLYLRGESQIAPSVAEQAKRNFQSQVNWMSPEVDKKAASHLSSAFKNEVENVAEQASPELAGAFKEAKNTYGMLAPVKEAAEKRAAQMAQSPFGGLGDIMSGGVGGTVGGMVGGPGGAVAGTAANIAFKRVVQPRLTSSGAVMTDYLADILRYAPEKLGKYAVPLQNALARGGSSLAATHYILQQTDPKYRELVNTSEEDRIKKNEQE